MEMLKDLVYKPDTPSLDTQTTHEDIEYHLGRPLPIVRNTFKFPCEPRTKQGIASILDNEGA